MYLPTEYFADIYKINYEGLFKKGTRLLLFDLDNTIADYETPNATNQVSSLIDKLKSMGFEVVIISNNSKKRVSLFENDLDVVAIHRLSKPHTHRIKKYLKSKSYKRDEMIWIGDQLMTDMKCANKIGIKSILVNPLKQETERWYTRFNRLFENRKLKKIKERYKDEFIALGLDKR